MRADRIVLPPQGSYDWTRDRSIARPLVASEWADADTYDAGAVCTALTSGPTALPGGRLRFVSPATAVSGILRTVAAGDFRQYFRFSITRVGLSTYATGKNWMAGPVFVNHASAINGATYKSLILRSATQEHGDSILSSASGADWTAYSSADVAGPSKDETLDVVIQRSGTTVRCGYAIPGQAFELGTAATLIATAGLIGFRVDTSTATWTNNNDAAIEVTLLAHGVQSISGTLV